MFPLHENRIKLRHLSCFVEVSTLRSFRRAAERLNLTQPAVSKAIAELEQILGSTLLTRNRRGVLLTEQGLAFSRFAGATLSALRQGVETVRQTRDSHMPPLIVGCLPTAAATLLPKAILHLKTHGFQAVTRVIIGTNESLMSDLRRGAVEIVVGRMTDLSAMHGLAFEPLYSEDILVAVRPGHPLLARPQTSIHELSRYTVLMPESSAIIRPLIERLFLSQGAPLPADIIETVSPTFGRAYLRSSDAIWIISRGVVADDLESGVLASLPFSVTDTQGPVGLTTKADVPLTVSAELLVRSLREVVGPLRAP